MTKERIVEALKIIGKSPHPHLNLINKMELYSIDAEGNLLPAPGEKGAMYRLGYIIGHLEGAGLIEIKNEYAAGRLIKSEYSLTPKGKKLAGK